MCWNLVVVYFWDAVGTSACRAIIPRVKNATKSVMVGTGMVLLSCTVNMITHRWGY